MFPGKTHPSGLRRAALGISRDFVVRQQRDQVNIVNEFMSRPGSHRARRRHVCGVFDVIIVPIDDQF